MAAKRTDTRKATRKTHSKTPRRKPERKVAKGGKGGVKLAILQCPDTVTWTMRGVCGANKTDAEQKAVNATKPHYSCQPGCVLNVIGTAGNAGRRCALRLNPPKFGRLYNVVLRITCR